MFAIASREKPAETWVQVYPDADEHALQQRWGPDYVPVHCRVPRITTREIGPAGEGTITQMWRRQA